MTDEEKKEAEAKRRALEERRREEDEGIEKGVKEAFDPKTIGWVRLAGSYLLKKDGSGLNLHFRSDHPSGEGHFFVPSQNLDLLARTFQHLSKENERRIQRLKEVEIPGKPKVT